MKALKQLLEDLKEQPEEEPIEPELKHTRKEQDRKIRWVLMEAAVAAKNPSAFTFRSIFQRRARPPRWCCA
jgi:hypothetical protein